MNPAAEIDSLITRFVAGQAFYDFWKAFMDFYEAFDDSVLSPEQGVRFEQLYEWVYMGQPDPTAEAERELGLVGESEMRERLRNFRIATTEGSTGRNFLEPNRRLHAAPTNSTFSAEHPLS